MAGLPGTGLGGIFYGLLVVWMAIREVWLSMNGKSDRTRWAKIRWFGALLAGIVLALWAEGWLIRSLLRPPPGLGLEDGEAGRDVAVGALTPALVLTPFVILVLLLAGMHLARLLYRREAPTAPKGDPIPSFPGSETATETRT